MRVIGTQMPMLCTNTKHRSYSLFSCFGTTLFGYGRHKNELQSPSSLQDTQSLTRHGQMVSTAPAQRYGNPYARASSSNDTVQ
jgi:hypothetical protein